VGGFVIIALCLVSGGFIGHAAAIIEEGTGSFALALAWFVSATIVAVGAIIFFNALVR
jgi:hypothetical protein